MKIQVLVTLDVTNSEDGGTPVHSNAITAALESVQNALDHARDMGFSHSFDDELCIEVKEVDFIATKHP